MQSTVSTDGFALTRCGWIGNFGANSRKRGWRQHGQDSTAKAFLAGATCVLAWLALWWLLIYAYQSPLEQARPEISLTNSASAQTSSAEVDWQIDDAAEPRLLERCGPGTIELNGDCVIGEEIQVLPSVGGRQ